MGEIIAFPNPRPQSAPMTLADLTPEQRLDMFVNAEWPENRVPVSVKAERAKRQQSGAFPNLPPGEMQDLWNSKTPV